jgi:hypothetical protein
MQSNRCALGHLVDAARGQVRTVLHRCSGPRSHGALSTATGSMSSPCPARPSFTAAMPRMPEPVPRSRKDCPALSPRPPPTVQGLQAQGRGLVVAGAEGHLGLDQDGLGRAGLVLEPGRHDHETRPDGNGREIFLPGAGPVGVVHGHVSRLRPGQAATRAASVSADCSGRSKCTVSRRKPSLSPSSCQPQGVCMYRSPVTRSSCAGANARQRRASLFVICSGLITGHGPFEFTAERRQHPAYDEVKERDGQKNLHRRLHRSGIDMAG